MRYVHIRLEYNINAYTVVKTQVKIEAETGKMCVALSPPHIKSELINGTQPLKWVR